MIETTKIVEKENYLQQNTNAIDTTTESVHLKLTQQYGDTKEEVDDEAFNKNNTQIKILSYINKSTKDTIIATIDSIGWSALEHFSIHKFSQNLSTSVDIELIEVCVLTIIILLSLALLPLLYYITIKLCYTITYLSTHIHIHLYVHLYIIYNVVLELCFYHITVII